MQIIYKKEPWLKFSIKVTLTLGIMFLIAVAFFSRFTFAAGPYAKSCIPEYSLYLVDKKDKKIIRNKIYAFKSKDLSPIYKKNTKMIKYIRAMPGDTVEINKTNQILINGQLYATGLMLAQEKLGQPYSYFQGEKKLTENQYWALGTSEDSFDSRYWGAISREDIIGRVYPIF